MRYIIVIISIVLGAFFYTLYQQQQAGFEDVNDRLKNGTMMNLNAGRAGERMQLLLEKGYYFDDKKDIQLIRQAVESGSKLFKEPIDNVGELNKSRFFIAAVEADRRGGKNFKRRALDSRSLLGFTGPDSARYAQEQAAPPALPARIDLKQGEYSITGKIIDSLQRPVAGVLVRMQLILPQDSTFGEEGRTEKTPLSRYVRTDAQGTFGFMHLPGDKAFNVLPLQPGSQFGRSQGVQELEGDATFTFRQNPHTIRLFSARDFRILKKEKSLIVRTPEEYNEWYLIIAASFFAGFFVLNLILNWKFRQADKILLPAVMLMTGISFLTLLSLQDPLRDRFLARDSLVFFGLGLLGILVALTINFRKLTIDSKFYRLLVIPKSATKARGWQWALLALALLGLTVVFGTGPEGSGVKVNLFGVQPSEVVKYAIILFLAGFFASNERFIAEYLTWQKRWYFFSFALAAMIIAILLYLTLGDLGPAMVVCFTFIILFSFSRGDFMVMMATILTYTLAVWLLNIWLATVITVVLLAAVMLSSKKRVSESAMMVMIVMAGFLLIDQLPYLDKLIPGPVNRLGERKSIWQDPWNNEVYGGDQVANGIWAIAGGGFTGQGLGEGFAKNIPEAHTDMILPAIGEEFGWMGVAGVFVLFLVFLNRAVTIGRQSGTPFLFYLCSGIGISLFVQFLLIAGGSTGALPLSGVALPFISYGGSSLVANMVAAGILLSVSQIKGTAIQMEYISKQQDSNLVPALLSASVAVLLLTVTVSRYVLDNKNWVVKPALVADRSGLRMFSYNPRISILMDKLEAGELMDRKGRIMATSKPEYIRKQAELLRRSGITYNLDSAEHKRVDRYYPFEEHAFFWTGDMNTGVFNGSTNGYFAEYEHGAELRGFQTPTIAFNTKASRYQENRFLARGVKEMTVAKRDYKALSPLLLSGINSAEVTAFKKRNRNVQLTVDAGLQAEIQRSMAADDSLKKSRVSVVIMEDNTGDVLASAMYPLPPIKDWEMLTMSVADQNRLYGWHTNTDLGFTHATQPGSTAKLVTTLAAFNKLGLDAAKRRFPVGAHERIRTKGIEPDETGMISLERALVKSNNVYYIKLANEEHLEEQMATLYLQTGMFLRGLGGYYYERPPVNKKQEEEWFNIWRKTEFNTKPKYDPNRIRRTRAKGISGMAWGQGELIATPASVARVAAGIANHGDLMPNRYVMKVADSATAPGQPVKLVSNPEYARITTDYMLKQSVNKKYTLKLTVAGKTGTPERIWQQEQINDGWYVFFAPKKTGPGHIVVCVRVESTRGSSKAVLLAGQHVVPALKKYNYVKDVKTK